MGGVFGVKYRILVSGGESCAVLTSYFVLLLYLSRVISAVKIQSISVPNRVNSSSSEPVKLDCVFEYENSDSNLVDKELVITWNVNKTTLLYQWINNTPTYINNKIKNRIDSNAKIAPNTRPTNMPLIFTTRSIDLTGLYTCKVSTFQGEDWQERLMQAFVPISEINLNKSVDPETNELLVTCSTEGVYPRPNLQMFINKRYQNASEVDIEQTDNLYNINATFRLPVNNLGWVTVFNCTISLPGANFSEYKTTDYKKAGYEKVVINDDSSSSSSSSSLTHSESPGVGLRNRSDLTVLLFTSLMALIGLGR